MSDPVPSVSIGTGLTVVTASAPVLTAAENDLFCARGQAVPIARRDSPTQITLKQPWPVASLSGEQAFSILSLGEYWRSAISINKRFADLLAKWEVVSPFKFDAAGTLAERDGYNNQPKGFVYIALDPLPVRIFIKIANTNSASDWSAAIYIGSGGQVEFQEALDQERQQRIQADAALGQRIDTLAAGADPNVRTDLNAEIARSTGKDQQHDTQIAGLRSDLNAEASVRGSADFFLGGRIDGEATARISADNATNARVDTEINARLSADVNLGTRITAEEAQASAAEAAEQARATAAETAEATARAAADIALGGRIDAEATKRGSADTALSNRLTIIEPYSGPSVGYLEGILPASVSLDPSGAGLSFVAPDQSHYILRASGRWVDPVAEERGRATAAEAQGIAATAAEAVRAKGAEVALGGRVTALEPYSGPSAGYIAGLLVVALTLDVSGAALAADRSDRVRWEMQATGAWANPKQQSYAGPSAGYGADGTLIPALRLDGAGAALSYDGRDGRRRVAVGPRMWALPVIPEYGPSAGYIDGVLARDLSLDPSGAALSSLGSDGLMRRMDPGGVWRRDYRPYSGPSAGYADGQPDSLLMTASLDASGALMRAQARGTPERGVEFSAVPGGLARRETAADVGLLTITGASIAVPSVRYRGPAGWAWSKPATLTVPAPASVAVSGEVAVLRYNDALWTVYQIVRGTLTVTRQSDGTAVAQTTDYTPDRERGILIGVKNVANYNVSLAYAGYKVRADRIVVDRATGLPSLVLGTETPRSASMLEAALPANSVEIFRAFVSVDEALATRCELTPTHLYDSVIRRDRAAAEEAEVTRNRRLLRPFRTQAAALRASGTTLQWGATGTSRTARVGNGASPAAQNTTPNGPRDRLPYYQLVAADPVTAAKIPSYDKGDGGSPYVEEGWNWEAIKLLRKMGSTVAMLNFAIQGTDSTATANGSGYFNQTHPDRLAALLSSSAHIVCWENGTNELGASFTYANMLAGGKAVLDAGKHLVLVGPAMINPRFRDLYAQWRYTCDAMRAVAEDLSVAYVDPRQLFETQSLGALRMCPREFSEASMQNHDGIREQRAIGTLLCNLL